MSGANYSTLGGNVSGQGAQANQMAVANYDYRRERALQYALQMGLQPDAEELIKSAVVIEGYLFGISIASAVL